MNDLYLATANSKFSEVTVCPELYPYVKLVYEAYDNPISLIEKNGVLKKTIKPTKKVSVFTVSGGKDSLSTYLKERTNNNLLCHVLDINPLYPSEKDVVKKLYKIFDEKISFFDFSLKDVKTWLPESVIKNQMIYALILDSLDFLPSSIAFGGTKKVGPQSMAFFHDNPLAFKLFYRFAKKAWGKHRILDFVEDEVEAYKIIYENSPENIDYYIGSCMSKYEDKEKIRRSIERKFKIKLDNSYDCGTCYKCVEKVLIKNKYWRVEYPKEYLEFCRKIIMNKIQETLKFNGCPKECLKERYPQKYLEKMEIPYLLKSTDKKCVFCEMIKGNVACHKVWEDEKHIAFLSIYPNTEGVTVVIPKKHYDSYVFDLPDSVVKDLVVATKKVAKLLDSKFEDVGRTALVFEGFGVNHVHAKLYPLHKTSKEKVWKKIESKINKYFRRYEGYVSSHDGKRASDFKLANLAKRIRIDK